MEQEVSRLSIARSSSAVDGAFYVLLRSRISCRDNVKLDGLCHVRNMPCISIRDNEFAMDYIICKLRTT
jgi:hypothetical protein